MPVGQQKLATDYRAQAADYRSRAMDQRKLATDYRPQATGNGRWPIDACRWDPPLSDWQIIMMYAQKVSDSVLMATLSLLMGGTRGTLRS